MNRVGAIDFTDKHGQEENRAGCLLANTAKFTRLQLEQCVLLGELLWTPQAQVQGVLFAIGRIGNTGRLDTFNKAATVGTSSGEGG